MHEPTALRGSALGTSGLGRQEKCSVSPCYFPLHPCGTGQAVELSWVHAASPSLHHPQPSEMPTGQAGRFLPICPVFAATIALLKDDQSQRELPALCFLPLHHFYPCWIP